MRFVLDHVAIAALDLAEGVRFAESALGVAMGPGGRHALMGTHNRLLGVGGGAYLEVIAIDPDASAPERPRWFALDDADNRARLARAPRLAAWVAQTDDIDLAVRSFGRVAGSAVEVSRGDLSWRLTVTDDGRLPFGGAFPALIAWPDGTHPTRRMADSGCKLLRLQVEHPQADEIADLLRPFLDDTRVAFRQGPEPRLMAEIATPGGLRSIG